MLSAQYAANAAEVVVAEVTDRVIRVLAGDLLQRLQLFVHGETLGEAMVENIIGQYPQPRRNGLRIPADHRLGVAFLHQFLHLFRLMQADGNVLLQIQRHLKSPRQALIMAVAVGGKHMHLLIAGVDQIDRFLLTCQQGRQGGLWIGKFGQQGIFCFAVVSQLAIQQAERFTHRLLFPQPEPEPVKRAVPDGAEDIQQRGFPHRHAPGEAEGEDGGNQRSRQQAGVQRTDLPGDAKQQRHHQQDSRQRNAFSARKLNQETAEGKQAAANDQAFEEAFMGGIETGVVAAGGH